MLCRSLVILLNLLFGHFVVCSSINGFWIPFDIFKLICCRIHFSLSIKYSKWNERLFLEFDIYVFITWKRLNLGFILIDNYLYNLLQDWKGFQVGTVCSLLFDLALPLTFSLKCFLLSNMYMWWFRVFVIKSTLHNISVISRRQFQM